MRFKFSLEVLPQVSGNVLPISYQSEMATAFRSMLTNDMSVYNDWLQMNGFDPSDDTHLRFYSVSNLYVPKIIVFEDRLQINVPRIQFWASFLPEVGTRELLNQMVLGQVFSIGDKKSAVSFRLTEISDVSPVRFMDCMEYQSLAPVVVKALRQNQTLEYLAPQNPYYAQFIYDGLVDRWEQFYRCPFDGIRGFNFKLLAPERRKAVNVCVDTPNAVKEVGYMLKFRIEMDPMLQEFAYLLGIGDDLDKGFGYLELLKKKK